MSTGNALASLTQQIILQMRMNGLMLETMVQHGILNRAQGGALIDEVRSFARDYDSETDQAFAVLWQQLREQFE